MKITLKELARLANVSVGTASMALNDKPGVNQETRKHVQSLARKLNYTPNLSARSLITKKSSTIGLVVTDITNPFFGLLVNELNNEVISRGYNLLLGVSGDKVVNECASVNAFISQQVEGVIVVPSISASFDLSHLYKLKQYKIPFVFATTMYPGIEANCVMTDLTQGSYMLTKFLIETGHKKIYIIVSGKTTLISAMRIEGYRKAFMERGMACCEDWIVEAGSPANFNCAYEAVRRVIGEKPDAITTINDVMAMGAMKCLKDNNIRVPEDISVAGYDDLLYTSLLETPLTTVRQPIADIAGAAVQLLLADIDGAGEPPRTVYVEPILKIRASTRTSPVSY